MLHRSVETTAAGLGVDGKAYQRLMGPLVRQDLVDGLLDPLHFPRAPIPMARFGLAGIFSAEHLASRRFETDEARGLFTGIAADSMLSLRRTPTAGYGLMIAVLGHLVGWPMARGGSQAIADALVAMLEAHGGAVELNRPVRSLDELPNVPATLLDLTPRQVVAIAGDRLPARYRRRLERYKYGPGVWKVDWALDGPARGPIPTSRARRRCTSAGRCRRWSTPRRRSSAVAIRSGRTCSSSSSHSSTPRRTPKVVRPHGPTAMCRTGPSSTSAH